MSVAPPSPEPGFPGGGREPLALIGRLDADETAHWLSGLRAAMPDEVIEPAQTLLAEGRADQVRLAIVANPDPADVRRFPGLQWIHSLWAGVEGLLAEPSFQALPIVRLIDPELARTMAEATLAWTLYLHREMPHYRAAQQASSWQPLPYRPAAERRIGLLGLGEMGRRAATSLQAAGFPVLGWRRQAGDVPGIECRSGAKGLDEVLATSDVVVLLLPLTPDTRHLINRDRLARLPAGASLINFGRGPLVHDGDLIAALDRGHLAHAVLDVFAQEPLPAVNPLWSHPRVTVLPHISASTTATTAAAIVASNVRRWRQSGVLPPTVDRAAGY